MGYPFCLGCVAAGRVVAAVEEDMVVGLVPTVVGRMATWGRLPVAAVVGLAQVVVGVVVTRVVADTLGLVVEKEERIGLAVTGCLAVTAVVAFG